MNDHIELIGGTEKRDIRIVDYDPAWPQRFDQERDRIAQALGTAARRIDHVGSTAVPGLAAKPIIDIDLSVPDVDNEAAYAAAKGPLIAEIAQRAEAWAQSCGWNLGQPS